LLPKRNFEYNDEKVVSGAGPGFLERVMVVKRSTLLVALASTLAVALAPSPAEARFGKRSGSSGGNSGGGVHGSSGGGGVYYGPRYYGPYRYYGWPSLYAGWGYGYYPFGYYPPYFYDPYAYPVAGQPVLVQQTPGPKITTTLALEGQTFGTLDSGGYHSRGNSGAVAGKLGFEGQRLGVNLQFTSIFIPRDNVSLGSGHDTIGLFNLYGTYALISHPHGRLRIEAGLTSAFAPDLTVAGPGGGFSAVILLGPVGIEGAIHGTPFPYRQLDWNTGLALNLGPLGLHGGWRRIYLDDKGLVDGIRNTDVFSGPYLGLTLTL